MKIQRVSLVFLGMLALILSGCSGMKAGNKNDINSYQTTLISRDEFRLLNNQALVDEKNSFETSFSAEGKIYGNEIGRKFVNWGTATKVIPSLCSYENFWNRPIAKITESNKVIGLAATLQTSVLSLENFQLTRASILGQYTLALKDEETTNHYFDAIQANLKSCASGVRWVDSDGNSFELFKEGPKKNFKFYKAGDQVLLRSGFDELLVLDFFIKSRFSITLIKIFVNDLNLPAYDDWSIFLPLVQDSIDEICFLENCEPETLLWEGFRSFVPNPTVAVYPKLD